MSQSCIYMTYTRYRPPTKEKSARTREDINWAKELQPATQQRKRYARSEMQVRMVGYCCSSGIELAGRALSCKSHTCTNADMQLADSAIQPIIFWKLLGRDFHFWKVDPNTQNRRNVWLSMLKYAHQLSDQNWRYSALKYVGFNPADQFTVS